MRRIFPSLAALVAVIACGVVHGVWTDRWMHSAEPAQSAAKLKQVSLSLGDWEGTAMTGPQGKDMAGALYHCYTNRKTGRTVTLFIVCDRPGPVSIHTPDVCYEAVGYEVSKPVAFAPQFSGIDAGSYWTARFHKKRGSDGSGDLRIFWSWNAGNGWLAADDARTKFASFPALFKIYLIHEINGDEPVTNDPSVDLLKQLVPELQRALFTAS
jgi:hypothetical protein